MGGGGGVEVSGLYITMVDAMSTVYFLFYRQHSDLIYYFKVHLHASRVVAELVYSYIVLSTFWSPK